MKSFLIVLMVGSPMVAGAMEISDITVVTSSKTGQAVVHAKNDEGRATLLSVGVVQVDSPYENGNEVSVDPAASNDIRFTPARSLVPAGQTVPVRFFYQGPKDDKERYYKVSWASTGVGMNVKKNDTDKKADVQFSSVIRTILVVPPAQQNFSYSYNRDSVLNDGNISFQALIYGPCKPGVNNDAEGNGNVCQEKYWVGPGRKVNFKRIDNSKGEVQLMLKRDGKYIAAQVNG